MPNKRIRCVECGARFDWTEGEQRYYAQRGLSRPKRCQACRGSGRSKPRAAGHRSTPDRARWNAPRRSATSWGLGIGGAALAALAYLVLRCDVPRFGCIYLFLLNLATLAIYGFDKGRAQTGKWRVPEVGLLGLALAGGSAGAGLGVFLFNHKSAKPEFWLRLALIMALHALLLLGYGWWRSGAFGG